VSLIAERRADSMAWPRRLQASPIAIKRFVSRINISARQLNCLAG
jgi:hypothetical protein